VGANRSRPSWNTWNPISPLQTVTLVWLVATLSYLALKLEGALIIHPQTVWPLWPGCALLVPVLLLVPRRIWLMVIAAAFAAFVLYDLQAGVPLSSIAWFIPADTVEVLIATLCLGYFFGEVPRLNSSNALAKYLIFAVILGPFAAAFVSARGISTDYWNGWGICFFSEVLAFLTLTPAILSWITEGHAWLRKPRVYHLEAAALFAGLVLLSYLNFTVRAGSSSPALLYSLVPLLLWSALRFGSIGTNSAVIVVAFLSIWGAVHGRGPFIGREPLHNIFSIQLFLISTAIPFMVLAALAEERKRTEEALRKSEERLRLAVLAGRMHAFEWDLATCIIARSGNGDSVLGIDRAGPAVGRQTSVNVHPDDQQALKSAIAALSPEKPSLEISHRMVRQDGTVIWVERNGLAYFDERGTMLRMVGIVADISERRKVQEALRQREQELLEAQRVAQVGSWQRGPEADTVVWSKELYRIAGRDPNVPPPNFREQPELYTTESWERLKCAVAEALRTGTPYTVDLEVVRPDGSTRWITDRGEVLRDAAGRITGLRGTAHDITERKRAEDELRASEEKFRSVFRNAGVGMMIVSPEGRFLAANEAFCECLGYAEEELLQKTVESVTLSEDRPCFSQKLREALEQGKSFQRVEMHCLHKSGRIVTTESSASLIRGPSGEPLYLVGEILDVTQRKQAEEALSGVSGRLIEAHEEERSWIARELHDDFNQRVALLAVILEKVKQDLPASERRGIEEASQQVADLGRDIHALSHRLHSSKLEYLGLVAACESFCRELSGQQNVEIDFHSQDIPKELPQEIALSLFRVLQEGLQNAVKHSGVRRFEVSLGSAWDEIHMSVHDSGVGFDLQKAMSGHGLGFASMKERMKLIGGHLSIDLKPQGGTTIHARAPLRLKTMSRGAGG